MSRMSDREPRVQDRVCDEIRCVGPAPVVSMLWEPTDPNDALETRFGFRTTAEVATWVTETLSGVWGISVDRVDRVVISAWNAMVWVAAGERDLIVKWSALPSVFARLEDAAAVTVWLDRHEVPVAVPIATFDGRRLVEVGNSARGRLRSKLPRPGARFLVGVLPVLDGELLDVADERHVIDAGEMLATVHNVLGGYADPVAGRRPTNGDQIVHNDFRSANVLHDGTRITAVLDLEEITYGRRVADLAKAAVMLGTRYRDWAPTPVAARTTFIDSYSERSPLTDADRRDLEAEMSAVLAAEWWH